MPYDIAAALQNPNIIGNALAAGQAGRAAGLQDQAIQKQNALASLAGQAYTAPAAQQNALVGKMVGIDPQAGLAVGGALAGRAQAQEVDHVKRLGGAARYMAQALQSKNPAQIEGAWQAVRPYLAQVSGKEPPQNWDPAMEPALYQAIAATGGEPDVKGVVTSGGQTLINPHNGAVMYRNPYAPKLIPNVPMGQGTAAGVFDANTEELRPAVGGMPQGGPQIDPMQPFIDQANAAIKMGAPQDQVEAWLQQQAQQIGAQPQVPGQPGQGGNQLQDTQAVVPAQFGVGTPKPAGSNLPRGYRLSADGQSLEAISGGPADKSGASSVVLGDPSQTGAAYLATITDPSIQQQVQAIAEGRMPLPKVSRPGKNGEISPQTLQQAVAQYDPTYDQADPTSRIKARNDFTSGKSAVQLRQLNTLLGHLGGLADAADKLDNTGSTIVNAAENAVGKTYNTKVSNFDAAARPAAEEFAALLKGGVPSVEEIKQAHDMLNANKTPEQLHGVIGTMAAQIQSRIAALNAQAKNSLGPFANKVTIITPEGQAALDKLRERGLIGKFDLGEEGTQQASQSSAQPRAVNSMGHAVVWNGSAWVPE